jgi:RHS repeat-associated protein
VVSRAGKGWVASVAALLFCVAVFAPSVAHAALPAVVDARLEVPPLPELPSALAEIEKREAEPPCVAFCGTVELSLKGDGISGGGGSVVSQDAWGNYRFTSELLASHNRFGFTGHEYDNEAGLYNAKARYFDPQLGRFLTQDSYLGEIDNPPSLHRYFYAAANPTRYVDPTGHAFTDAELREIGRQFNQRTAPLQKDNRPSYEKGWWTNAVETFSFEFTGRMFSPGFKTYQGLKNMSQLGGEDPSLFIEGQAETVIAGALPLIVKETAGALVSKIPVLGRDVVELGGKVLERAKVAFEEVTRRLPIEWSANPGANLGNLRPRRVKAPTLTPAEQLKVNEAKGAAFDADVGQFLSETADDVVPQVSIRPNTPEGPAPFRFRPDYMTRERGTEAISPVEAKSSSTARLTRRQSEGIPLVEQHGGTVVGKAGGEKYPPGTPVPPGTTTPVIRPDDLAKKRR